MKNIILQDNKKGKTITKFRKDEDKSIVKLSKLSKHFEQNNKLADDFVHGKIKSKVAESISKNHMLVLSDNLTKYYDNQNAIEEQKESDEGSVISEQNNRYNTNTSNDNIKNTISNNDYSATQENENTKSEIYPSSSVIKDKNGRSKSIISLKTNFRYTKTNINSKKQCEKENNNDANENNNDEISDNKKDDTIKNMNRTKSSNNKIFDLKFNPKNIKNFSDTSYGVKLKNNFKKINNTELKKIKNKKKIQTVIEEFNIILYYEGKHQELKITKDSNLSDLVTLIRRKLCPYYKLEDYQLLYKLQEIDFQIDYNLSDIFETNSDIITLILKKRENSSRKINYKDTVVYIENFPSFTDLATELNKFFKKETRESYFDVSYKGNICKVTFTSSEKAFSLIIFLTTLKTKNPIYKRLKVNLDYKLKVVTNVSKLKKEPIKLVLPLLELSHDNYSLDKKNRIKILKDDSNSPERLDGTKTLFSKYMQRTKKKSNKKGITGNSVDAKIARIKKNGKKNSFLNVIFDAIDDIDKDKNSEEESREDDEYDNYKNIKLNNVLLSAKSKRKQILKVNRKK